MPVRKKRATTRKKKASGLVSFVKKVAANKSVKAKAKKVKDLEKRLAAAKREKAAVVKKVRKSISRKK